MMSNSDDLVLEMYTIWLADPVSLNYDSLDMLLIFYRLSVFSYLLLPGPAM